MSDKIHHIPFEPMSPFPLYAIDAYTYQAAKLHSEEVDAWLGFDTAELEKQIEFGITSQKHQTWSQISSQSFQTPYCEIRSLLSHLKIDQFETVVDLGCAYGRMAFVMGRHHQNTKFIGYEVCEERVRLASDKIKNWKFLNCEIHQQDLSAQNFMPASADCYFLYDYGHNWAIQKTLGDLKQLSLQKNFYVVARGRASRHFIQTQNPWLSEINSPEHFDHFSIYKS